MNELDQRSDVINAPGRGVLRVMKRFLVMLVWCVAACGRLSVDDGRGAVTGQVLGVNGGSSMQ